MLALVLCMANDCPGSSQDLDPEQRRLYQQYECGEWKDLAKRGYIFRHGFEYRHVAKADQATYIKLRWTQVATCSK